MLMMEGRSMQQPEPVVVKDFMGRALNRWMVGVVGSVARITNDDGADAVRKGQEPEFSVGFPVSDIYRYTGDIRISDGDEPNWADFTARF
jgi:hypothetical protein